MSGGAPVHANKETKNTIKNGILMIRNSKLNTMALFHVLNLSNEPNFTIKSSFKAVDLIQKHLSYNLYVLNVRVAQP